MSGLRPTVFARGAKQDLLSAGHPERRMKAACRWPLMGFRSYIDTQMTGALKITRLIAPSINSDIEDGAVFPIRTPRADALRGKLRIFPGRELPQYGPNIGCGSGPWVFSIRI